MRAGYNINNNISIGLAGHGLIPDKLGGSYINQEGKDVLHFGYGGAEVIYKYDFSDRFYLTGMMMIGAGHLVHMPAHIYIRTGKYHEGSLANIRAVKSDEEYINQCNQQGFYPISYYPHNYHFLWATATLEGDSKTAIDAALKTSQKPPDSLMEVCGYQTLQHFSTIPLYAYVTFGKWDEILDYPQPQDERPYMQAVWHYARAMAFIAKDKLDKASEEIKKLSPFTENKSIE